MSFLSNIFTKNKAKTMRLDSLGEFSYFNDGRDEYWKVEKPVGLLPSRFDFGAVSGSLEGPYQVALDVFQFYAERPENLYSYLNDLFYSKLKEKYGDLTIKDIQSNFYLKSLTCESKEEFEFGFHSYSDDVFVELFCKAGSVTEVHIDEGCCEYV
ncbi:hypothetical protein ACJJI3_11070 [Microbulbifer sp. ZKSA004]|uniref:hypothetical protein n=1 Tax=Microbulbifer sp. ZKSA004 TaxID=3243389 RepID=UPI0040391C4D